MLNRHGMVPLEIVADSVIYCEGHIMWVKADDILRIEPREIEDGSIMVDGVLEVKYREEGSYVRLRGIDDFEILEVKAKPQQLLRDLRLCDDDGKRRRGPKKKRSISE